MAYIDGFVLPVPKKNLAAYRRHTADMRKLWLKHGVLKHVVAVADDVKPGQWTSFPQSVKLKAGEIVSFGYMVHKSRASRNKTLKNLMADPAVEKVMKKYKGLFDGKRFFWGGFKPIVAV